MAHLGCCKGLRIAEVDTASRGSLFELLVKLVQQLGQQVRDPQLTAAAAVLLPNDRTTTSPVSMAECAKTTTRVVNAQAEATASPHNMAFGHKVSGNKVQSALLGSKTQ